MGGEVRRILLPILSACLWFSACDPLAARRAPKADLDLVRIQKLAEKGSVQHQIELAGAYLAGSGVAQDAALAARWYRKAAESGNPFAEDQIGRCYQLGIGVPVDMKLAFHWFQLAASGLPAAKVNLAQMYVNGFGVAKNPAMGMDLLLEAIDKGVGVAATYLGDMYLFGVGVPQDRAAAESWFERGARMHDPIADFNLASLYSIAADHPHDLPRAVGLLRLSAGRGYVPAMGELGRLLVRQPELAESRDEARVVLEQAAGAGSWRSSTLLGILARDGKTMPADPGEAYYHFQVAALVGGAEVRSLLDADLKALERHLSREEQESALARAQSWFQQHPLALDFVSPDDDVSRFFPQAASAPLSSAADNDSRRP